MINNNFQYFPSLKEIQDGLEEVLREKFEKGIFRPQYLNNEEQANELYSEEIKNLTLVKALYKDVYKAVIKFGVENYPMN